MPFLQQEHLQISATYLANWTMCDSLQFLLRERPEKYFVLLVWRREYANLVLNFLLFDRHEYRHGNFRSIILVSIFTLWVYLTSSLFLRIWLTESILPIREMHFRGTCFLLAFNNKHPKFVWWKLVASLEWHCILVSIKCHNLLFFSKGGDSLVPEYPWNKNVYQYPWNKTYTISI